MEPPFFAIQLFDDPTPNGLINQRYAQHMLALIHETDISDEEGMEALNLVFLVAKKLAAAWKHKATYTTLEDSLIEKARANPLRKGQQTGHVEVSQDLFIEFDEFLVQVKSCLDHVVKFPALFVGKKVWALRTFSDKGQGVLNAIERNIPKKYGRRAENLDYWVKHHMSWMGAPIDARDKINHFIDGGINFHSFTIFSREDSGNVELRVPKWDNDHTAREFLDIVWWNLFSFAEDFTAVSAHLRYPEPYVLARIPTDVGSVDSPWHITTPEAADALAKKLGTTPRPLT